MRKMISLVFIISAMTFILQGCYTILDLPKISYDEYTYTPGPIYQPERPTGGPWPHPTPIPPHHPIRPIIIIEQPVISNPAPNKDRKSDIQKIRDDGNGRGNSGRNTDFNKSTETRTDTNSSASNNSSSNIDNSRGSSNTGDSGNNRR